MAVISQGTESVFRLNRFSGLNESPSGDAGLSTGEAAEMVNFRVTREGSLQVRPGTRSLWRFDGPVEGLWQGTVGGRLVKVAAAEGKLWLLEKPGEASMLGNIGPGRCRFFSFGKRLYILTPKRYLVWPGYGQAADVVGYRPMVVVSATPQGGGTPLEGVNRLTGARRGLYSPDGASKVFALPEREVTRVDYVIKGATGEHLPFTADKTAGTVTLERPPEAGTNTLEIGWTKGSGQRGQVTGMACWELYSGETDQRVFLYGNGTNAAYYSGVDYDGQPNAAYFPEGNVIKAGNDNSPITGMIRHFSRMLVFKPEGAYQVESSSATLENGASIFAPYLTPIQREVGNVALGQVSLVDNDPWTLWGGGIYRWRTAGGYVSRDERSAQRISQRVMESLAQMDLTKAEVFDDQERQEWYISEGGVTLVHNYAVDGWYRYENFPARCFGVLDGDLHFGTEDGRVCRVSREYRNDDALPIRARWRSGSMAFDKPFRRKWGKWLWVAMKPESGSAVTVTTRTDRRGQCPRAVARASLMNYRNANYAHWSYSTNRQPRVQRVRVQFGPAAYEQVILESDSASETATILEVTGNLRSGRVT